MHSMLSAVHATMPLAALQHLICGKCLHALESSGMAIAGTVSFFSHLSAADMVGADLALQLVDCP